MFEAKLMEAKLREMEEGEIEGIRQRTNAEIIKGIEEITKKNEEKMFDMVVIPPEEDIREFYETFMYAPKMAMHKLQIIPRFEKEKRLQTFFRMWGYSVVIEIMMLYGKRAQKAFNKKVENIVKIIELIIEENHKPTEDDYKLYEYIIKPSYWNAEIIIQIHPFSHDEKGNVVVDKLELFNFYELVNEKKYKTQKQKEELKPLFEKYDKVKEKMKDLEEREKLLEKEKERVKKMEEDLEKYDFISFDPSVQPEGKYIKIQDDRIHLFLRRHITRELDVKKVHNLMDEEIMKILPTIGRKAPYELN